MTQSDGNVYFMPGFTYHSITRYSQILWINKGWLDNLGLALPTTTDELYVILKAFRDNDPNVNGIKDEIPMAGTETAYSKQPYDNLLNAFIYYVLINKINKRKILEINGVNQTKKATKESLI